jgi:hypothetical protein
VRNHPIAILMTKGSIPRLETCRGMEVPLPSVVENCVGVACIGLVQNNVMSLAK